jgi:phosphoglycolate phosphatase-like HAD superfamily hydrolase
MSGNQGNIISKYSLSPKTSLINAFHNKGIMIHNSLLNNIHVNKLIAIRNIMNDEYIKNSWFHIYGYYPDNDTCLHMYEEFIKYQLNKGVDDIEILPGIYECIKTLSDNNITTGVISKYNKPITMSIREKLIENNIFIDKYVSSGCIDEPNKDNMVKYIMNGMSLTDPKRVWIVENNPNDIIHSKNLGYNTVGISGYRWDLKDKLISAFAM